jgi:hypothetical protein
MMVTRAAIEDMKRRGVRPDSILGSNLLLNVVKGNTTAPAAASKKECFKKERLDKIERLAIHIGSTHKEASALINHFLKKSHESMAYNYKDDMMMAFKFMNAFSEKHGITKLQSEPVLREKVFRAIFPFRYGMLPPRAI